MQCCFNDGICISAMYVWWDLLYVTLLHLIACKYSPDASLPRMCFMTLMPSNALVFMGFAHDYNVPAALAWNYCKFSCLVHVHYLLDVINWDTYFLASLLWLVDDVCHGRVAFCFHWSYPLFLLLYGPFVYLLSLKNTCWLLLWWALATLQRTLHWWPWSMLSLQNILPLHDDIQWLVWGWIIHIYCLLHAVSFLLCSAGSYVCLFGDWLFVRVVRCIITLTTCLATLGEWALLCLWWS